MIRSTISKLRSLRDVDITGLADGDGLFWNVADGKFEAGTGGGGGGSGVHQQGWVTTIIAETDYNESAPQSRFDWSSSDFSAPTNAINAGAVPDWAHKSIAFPATFQLDAGTYLINVQLTVVKQDSFQGATSVDGLDGYASFSLSRRAGNPTALTILTLDTNVVPWDEPPFVGGAVANNGGLFIVSVPADTARQNIAVDSGIGVSDPSYFVHGIATVTITKVA